MTTPHPLPEALVETVAQRFCVIGEPMRVKLLDRLRDGSATVGELVVALDASQQNVSKHLGVLHQAGIVSRAKEGTSVRYAIAVPMLLRLMGKWAWWLPKPLDRILPDVRFGHA